MFEGAVPAEAAAALAPRQVTLPREDGVARLWVLVRVRAGVLSGTVRGLDIYPPVHYRSTCRSRRARGGRRGSSRGRRGRTPAQLRACLNAQVPQRLCHHQVIESGPHKSIGEISQIGTEFPQSSTTR